jgi:porin
MHPARQLSRRMQRRVPVTSAKIAALLLATPAWAEGSACEAGAAISAGVCLQGEALIDVVTVARGGLRRGEAALGQLRLRLEADLGMAAGLDRWRFAAGVAGIYGRQAAATRVGSLAAVSNAEALSALRLGELWLEREFDGIGSLRFGQLAADAESAVADAAGNLVNGTFGWPVALGSSMPAGGAAYPFAAPGLRFAFGDPVDGPAFRIGLFAGNPGGRHGEATDPQRHNRYGTLFPVSGGAFTIAEGSFAVADTASLKLGGWFHNGAFNAQRRDAAGLSLADPAGSGVPRRHANNYGGYGVAEATLWRDEAGQRVAAFWRAFAQPGDRNLVSAQFDAGLAWYNPFGRDGDALSLGVSQARIGRAARGLDRDRQALGEARVTRDAETVIEANYEMPLVPAHLFVRPLVQWIIHPGAREPDPRAGPRPLRDAVVLGFRLRAAI